ncbi:MAG: aminotransferase class V-fold PLP-dependent enzyme [Proteobacteria bacterium]|nr:aminotransferase class V-fold PLP-dependent enzyme [Pseudomonadota bacterium]
MTVAEILTDERLRQDEFPVCRSKAYLAHAGVAPLARCAADAIGHYSFMAAQDDQETCVPKLQRAARESASRLLAGSQPDEIAFVGPTSLALSHVAGGLTFRRNDNIVIYHDDFPSNVYPWMALAAQGVKVRYLNTRELGRIRPVDVLGQVDENTRLVALGSAHFIAGWRIDLDAIGKALRARGILFCVDAMQTLGAFPISVANVDFLAADGHKWLLAPCAAGILYVRKDLQDKLRPITLGWNNVRCPNFAAQDELAYQPGARRFEAGTHNVLGLVGLKAAMDMLAEVGVANIATELLRKRALLVPALQDKGWTVLNATAAPENCAGIVSITREVTDLPALHAKLTAADVITSLRADRSGKQYLRLSPHFYNTDEELGRALELL